MEVCGDGIVQTSLGEQCDDGNTNNLDDCTNNCLQRGCGDAYVDLDGLDNDIDSLEDNEECDPGRMCLDGSSCVETQTCGGNASECQVYFTGLCTSSCKIGYCGDNYVQS